MSGDGKRAWQCPWCSKVYRIAAGANDPTACPACVAATPPKEPPPNLEPPVSLASRVKGAYGRLPGVVQAIPAACGVVFLGLVALVALQSIPGAADDEQPDSQVATSDPPATIPDGPSIGDTVSLRITGDGPVLVFKTRDAIGRFSRASAAGDDFGINEMLSSGEILPVPADTRARIIDAHFAVREVRVEHGRHAGDAGWVPMEWVE